MAVTVKIGDGDARVLSEVTDKWIVDQIGRRQRDQVDICVVVSIELAGINLRLTTPTCSGGIGGRPPNHQEQEIINLWNERKLNSQKFTSGDLIAFLHQLQRFI